MGCAKERSGPLKPGVETVEGTVKAVLELRVRRVPRCPDRGPQVRGPQGLVVPIRHQILAAPTTCHRPSRPVMAVIQFPLLSSTPSIKLFNGWSCVHSVAFLCKFALMESMDQRTNLARKFTLVERDFPPGCGPRASEFKKEKVPKRKIIKKDRRVALRTELLRGVVPGVEVGDKFYYRIELAVVGLHRPFQAGVDYKHVN
ncbi:hypothetical protein CRG98_028061 [Punica granatum]|uniref:YDG domain-containing protein n=1 Tax=Punica granatum TaxID=22663 RepID=A0A2I0J5I9_PUNGR|nr:hypothetical protein CRG98_028061 [Punica granatum]